MAVVASRAVSLPAPRWRAASVLAVTVLALAAGLGLESRSGAAAFDNPFLPAITASGVLYGVLGHLVARRHRGHPVARTLQLTGMTAAAVVLTGGLANAALFGPLPATGATFTLWLNRWLWVPLLGLQTIGLLLAYPDGRLPSPRWRAAAVLAAAGPALSTVVAMATPFSESVWREVPVRNPVAEHLASSLPVLAPTALGAFLVSTVVAAAAVVVRLQRATGDARARLALVAVPAVLVPPGLAASLLGVPGGGLAEMATGLGLAAAVTVAMVRHRMYDVDVVVNEPRSTSCWLSHSAALTSPS